MMYFGVELAVGAVEFISQEVVNAVLACVSLRIWSGRWGSVLAAFVR